MRNYVHIALVSHAKIHFMVDECLVVQQTMNPTSATQPTTLSEVATGAQASVTPQFGVSQPISSEMPTERELTLTNKVCF